MESNDKLEQMLQQMYAQESLHDEDIDTSDIIDEEWVKFEAEHFNSVELRTESVESLSGEGMAVANSKFYTLHSKLIKIAAMFIGVLMLSGIAYAAVHIIRSQETGGRSQETTAVANSQLSTVNSQLAEQDSVLHKPVVFEDAELNTILREVATFYQCETVYKNEKVKHVRLYFTWDKTKPIDEVVETFNKFERFHITRENKKLIVE